MKRLVSVALAILLVLVAAVPAFAAESPIADHDYKINITVIPAEGGDVTYEYKYHIDENGEQRIHLSSDTHVGYTFNRWEINGNYITDGKLTDPELDIIITSDISVVARYTKDGAPDTQPATSATVKTDTSPKSPQTGSTDAAPFVVLSISLIAAAAAVVLIKTGKVK